MEINQYELLIQTLLEKIETQEQKINELEFRLINIRMCLDSKVSNKRYGEVKTNEESKNR